MFVDSPNSKAGFTLLEMLFVMFIVGLLTSLMAPRLGANLDHFEALSQRKALEDQLRQLPRRTRYAGKKIELPKDLTLKDIGDGSPALLSSEGWTLSATPPLLISPSGSCSASVLELIFTKDPSVTTRYNVTELSCEITPLPN